MKVAYAKKLAQLLIASGSLFLVFGCAEPKPSYIPKALESQARGITTATSTPYNCKVLGEVEGRDDASGTQGATKERLREGAINDLRNEASSAVGGENKRIMLKINKEEIQCSAAMRGKATLQNIKCTHDYEVPKGAIIIAPISYRIHADVYDCGQK